VKTVGERASEGIVHVSAYLGQTNHAAHTPSALDSATKGGV